MTPEEKKKLLDQLEALKIFPNNKLVKELRKQILKKLQRTEQKLPLIISKDIANIKRSKSGKKHHRYIRLVRDNFPNLKYSEIRKQFSKRKQGKEVSIPDVIWQNPSP
jgi:hypothetical protein